jgi:hypothetical protein
MRLDCETEGCKETATGTWRVYDGKPVICCDEHNPAAETGSAPGLPVGFTYIRWFPMPKDVPEDWLLQYVSPEVLAKAYAR